MNTRSGSSVIVLAMLWWLACGAGPATGQYPDPKDGFP